MPGFINYDKPSPGKQISVRQDVTKKRAAVKQRVRRTNRATWRKKNKDENKNKLHQNIIRANSMLGEVKALASTLRPFLQNGAVMLGQSFDGLIEAQIQIALTGSQTRMVFDKKGEVVLDDKGEPELRMEPVDARTQVRVRQQLIEFFPKLIPEDTSKPEIDPIMVIAERMAALRVGGVIRETTQIEVSPTDPKIAEAVGTVIDHGSEATVELTSQNA